MSAVLDADEWGDEQELLRLQAILNDQAEKMERRREAERDETRLANKRATKAGAPDAAKGAARPSVPAFWTAGPDTIGDDLAAAACLRLDSQDLNGRFNHGVTPLHSGPLRHTREVADNCWDRAWLNPIVWGPVVPRGGAKAEHSSAASRVDEALNNSRHSATAETAETALLPPPAIPEHAEVDGRPVRGVVALQAHPSPRANERPRSALLIASKGSLMVEELRQPYTRLLELPLQHVATQAVPGRDTMFHIAACPPGTEQRDLSTIGTEGIVVVLRDCSLRDRWLEALEAAGQACSHRRLRWPGAG
jgi:hypothetical protein